MHRHHNSDRVLGLEPKEHHHHHHHQGKCFVHKEENTFVDAGGKQQAVMSCQYLKPLQQKKLKETDNSQWLCCFIVNMISHLPLTALTMTSDTSHGPKGVKIMSLLGTRSGSLLALVAFGPHSLASHLHPLTIWLCSAPKEP